MQASTNTPSLLTVISEYTRIEVDDYQRTYAWGRDQINELFDDVKECAENGEAHFFGSLIFQSKPNDSKSTIVDGQQRLTTIFVLMTTLRDEINKLGIDTLPVSETRKLPVGVINEVWKFLYVDNDDDKPRFRSNRFLKTIFDKSVYPEPSKQSKIAERDKQLGALTLDFRKAVKSIRDLVREDLEKYHSPIEKLERIYSFVEAISNKFIVLRVSTHDISESLEIFLTLNNRGLPLGASDLVRGDIIAKMGEGETEDTKVKLHRQIFEEWSDIADNVREVEIFLRHWLVATGKDKIQKKKVFDHVAKRLKDSTAEGRKQKAILLWKEIQDASVIYQKIIDPKMGGTSQFHLEILNGYWKSHRILLLHVLDVTDDAAVRDSIIRQIFVLCFRWQMVGGNAQVLETKFQDMGNDYRETGNATKLIDALKTETAKISQEQIELFLKESVDGGYIGRALLYCLEMARAPKKNPTPFDSKVHLEHIAPQTPTDGWKADLFNGNEDLYEFYDVLATQIGNVTLLDHKINMSIKQLPFRDSTSASEPRDKISEYANNSFKLTDDVISLQKWDQSAIEDRTAYMIDAFNFVFSIEPNQGQLRPLSEWSNRHNV